MGNHEKDGQTGLHDTLNLNPLNLASLQIGQAIELAMTQSDDLRDEFSLDVVMTQTPRPGRRALVIVVGSQVTKAVMRTNEALGVAHPDLIDEYIMIIGSFTRHKKDSPEQLWIRPNFIEPFRRLSVILRTPGSFKPTRGHDFFVTNYRLHER